MIKILFVFLKFGLEFCKLTKLSDLLFIVRQKVAFVAHLKYKARVKVYCIEKNIVI